MSKTIPIALLADYQEDATTFCKIVKVECVGAFAGTVLGFSGLDAGIVYDDGDGVITYRADNGGFMPERLQVSSDMDVDNTDLVGWLSDTGVTDELIRAGMLDFAKVSVYEVNYLALTNGHSVVAYGTLGETRYGVTGWRNEFRSLKQQLRQPESLLYSLKCRAIFGDSKCTKAFTWVVGTITAVDGTEPNRVFTASSLGQATGHFEPGVVEVTSGDNLLVQMDVETFTSGGIVELSLPLAYNLTVGTTFRIRQDCNKVAVTRGGVTGHCKDRHNNLVNFRGEHLIPVTDAGSSMIPGAHITRSS